MADADAARDTPKVQLPPFTPPKFHWNQDNLYKQFRSFKRVVEFAFKGQCEKCSNNMKCGSILNWLGIEAYPIYDNLPVMDAQKQDPEQLLAAFENISNLNVMYSSPGTLWVPSTAMPSKPNQNFTTS